MLLHEAKQFLYKSSDMKDIGEVFYVVDIKIYKEDLNAYEICFKKSISIKL